MEPTASPASPNATFAIVQEIGALKALVEHTRDSLNRQREMLQKRGIGMADLTLHAIDGLIDAFNKFVALMHQEQHEVRQLRSLAENAAALNRTLVLDEVLSDAMDGLIGLSGGERGCIILVDEATGDLDFRILSDNETIHNREKVGRFSGQIPPEKTSGFSRSVIRQVIESGEALLSSNINDDARLSGVQSIIVHDLRSVVCAPMRVKDTMLGVVYVDNRLKSGAFGERERTLIAAFANQVAVAIANARLFAELQRTLADIIRVKDLTDNVFNSLDSSVITTDRDGVILRANRAAADLLEVPTPDALAGKALKTVAGVLYDALDSAVRAVLETSEVQVVEAEVPSGRKARSVLQAKVSPLRDKDGYPQGAAMVIDDLTDQRDRNETLRILRYYLPTAMLENINEIAGIGLDGERREVTCMFIDTYPLVHLPTGLRPQEVMQNVNVYLSLASEGIHDSGGVIDKYMGTEIMALFNSQLNPLKHHAAAAVEAALRIRDYFEVLYKSLGMTTPLYRIGINTGVATLGNIGSHNRRDFTALGDSINLSKRLEENATDGQIIISEATREHLQANPSPAARRLRFERLTALQVRGRQQQTELYEVFGV
ncbi:MAG: PAS domain-containing protein [Anaerolineae bacterium]|nr:PAS domain-containing protein [Anaerolineae bacterium]